MIFQTRQEGQVRFWRFNRPERGNGLGTSMMEAMTTAMAKLQSDLGAWENAGCPPESSPCRVLVIEAVLGGKSKNIWIAGGDLIELAELPAPSDGEWYSQQLSGFLANIESLPIPVIASIGGSAIGGGAELALAADLRFGSEHCSFEFRQLQIGLTTGYGSCHRLVAAVGLSAAKDLLFRGKKVAGFDLIGYGLVHELVTTNQELTKLVKKAATDLCRLHPQALREQKKMLSTAADLLNAAHRSEESKVMASLWMNEFHKAALSRFVDSKKDQT